MLGTQIQYQHKVKHQTSSYRTQMLMFLHQRQQECTIYLL
jgi:hypothetical protein